MVADSITFQAVGGPTTASSRLASASLRRAAEACRYTAQPQAMSPELKRGSKK